MMDYYDYIIHRQAKFIARNLVASSSRG